ncbi:MAG: UDP-N-acetylmuramate dehydrogenase [Clostridia bacterium]|nr:UDP-N-acetylmuramate dehydrogenase [Clostridia bacterium]
MDVKKVEDFTFAKYSTYGCGGKAKSAFMPVSAEEAIFLFDDITKNKENFCILGNGSDVLASDKFYDGSVILTKGIGGIKLLPNGNLYCGCGVNVSVVLKYCLQNNLGGLEFLTGIPATIGGACYMNAGAAQKYIGDRIISVTIYDGKIRKLSNKDCYFTYKHSTMRGIKCIILGCELAVDRVNRHKLEELCRYYLSRRKGLPQGKSCGCVFKNPQGESAGGLIQAAGLKGKRIGNAYVSEEHANFIINGGGSAKDVYNLIAYVKQTVYDKFATELEEEVCYIGDFK